MNTISNRQVFASPQRGETLLRADEVMPAVNAARAAEASVAGRSIRRVWHAYTSQRRADEFEKLLRTEVLEKYTKRDVRGYRGAKLLRRNVGDEVEFILNADFANATALKLMSGDSRRLELPEEARSLLIRSDQFARDYELVGSEAEEAADVVSPVKLAPGMWFVKRDRGNGSVPVTQEGHQVVARFVVGMIAGALAALAVAVVGGVWGPSWMIFAGFPVYVALAIVSASYFIGTVQKHTDYSITYSEYLKARTHA